MKAESIHIQSMPLLEITNCKIVKKVNTHLSAEIRGFLKKEKDKHQEEYLQEENVDILILSDTDNKWNSVFKGLITAISVSAKNGLAELVIKAESYTLLLDIENKFRVFQDVTKSYKEVAKYIVEQNKNTISIFNRAANVPIHNMLVQYKETDWEFLKRVGAELNMLLVADCINDKASFYFGVPERTNVYDVNCLTVQKSVWAENGRKIQEMLIESRDILNLLDRVVVMGITVYVYKAQMEIKNGELVNKYILRRQKDFYAEKYYNPNLAGLSVPGRVRDIKNAQVQILLDDDLVKSENHKLWFDFATVYSSSDGSGWYCMPERGDRIRLYFPDEKEKNAYVISSVPSERENRIRTKPDEKSIRTVYDKEIRFTPDKIIITNHNGIKIILDDKKGVEIISNRDIDIKAGGAIQVEGGDGIEILSDSGIILRQDRNILMVRDGVLEQGLNIEHR